MKKVLFPELVGEMAKRGETQKELSQILGLSRVSTCYKMTGKSNWTSNEIQLICERYGRSFEELFKKNEE